MATHMDRMKVWIDGFADDVAVVQRLVELVDASKEARTFGAAALGYLVSRMDLVPDWEESAGLLDDAMVLRTAAALASDKGLGEPPVDLLRDLGRLANDAEVVADFLGPALHARFKRFVEGLVDKPVRGRSPASVVDDAKARRDLFAEVADELKRLPAAPMSDPDAIERQIKNAISQKLAG